MVRLLTISLSILVVLVVVLPTAAADLKTIHPISYASDSPDSQVVSGLVLDQATPSPAVVFLNSGGWNSGPQEHEVKGNRDSKAFNEAGFSTFFVSHRSLYIAPWPAQIQDVRRAVKFIRSKASEWNIDPDRIAINGRSSGGHLAMMTGFLPEPGDPTSSDPVECYSSEVQAIINGSGPADLALMTRQLLKKDGAKGLKNILIELLRVTPEEFGTREFYKRLIVMSPINYIDWNSPPVFLQYLGPENATDPNDPRMEWDVHSPISGVLLADRLESFNVPYDLFMVPDLAKRQEEALQRKIAFLRRHLKLE
jgi:acetyl esterase/lipase